MIWSGSISAFDWNWLERPFSEDERVAVICSCAGNNAPGVDGLSMAFFQQCQSMVRQEVMDFFSRVFHLWGIREKLDATFIALIMEVGGTNILGICVYKIPSKVIRIY